MTEFEVAKRYESCELDFMFIDNACMQLVQNPGQFDVIVTSNMFGDILSDLASVIPGAVGLMPSYSLGTVNLYEPIGGSAPQLPRNVANPTGQILSAAMLLEHSLKMKPAADLIIDSVDSVLQKLRTRDLAGSASTEDFGKEVRNEIKLRLS